MATPPLLSKYLIFLPPLDLASFLLSPPVVLLFLQPESEGEKMIEIEGKERGGRRERGKKTGGRRDNRKHSR